MKLDKAKEIIRDYLEYSIDYEIDILGRDHEYSACDCSLGEIKDAFNLLDEQDFL